MLQLNSEAADILNDLQQVLNKELDYLSEIFAKRLESSFYSIKIMSLHRLVCAFARKRKF